VPESARDRERGDKGGGGIGGHKREREKTRGRVMGEERETKRDKEKGTLRGRERETAIETERSE